MNPVLEGDIVNNIPAFSARVNGEGILAFCSEGDLSLTVDTGFTGGIALPQGVLDKMALVSAGEETFILATGDAVEVEMHTGIAQVVDESIETVFIRGDALVGVEFLASAGRELSFDFLQASVTLKR